jgi:hypothetical protein
MASLTLSTAPGFTAIPAANFDAGNPATDSDLKALRSNAEFAAVRNEQFWGFYRNGETVALPVSPADGYEYARSECLYSWSIYSTGGAPADLGGTHATPSPGGAAGPGEILQTTALVDQASGVISMGVAYFKTSQTNTLDGILLVITHAQRSR